jgi:para-nitrobenzyl esterase
MVALHNGAVFVSFNYRLGVLGFLGGSGVAAESPGQGQAAMLDQVLALNWVKTNINAFGGDPGRVTIMGESAGGISVCLLMVNPAAAGLFHAAVIESGPCDGYSPKARSDYVSQAFYNAASGLCPPPASGADASTMACLRGLPLQDIMARAKAMGGQDVFSPTQFQPYEDGVTIPKSPLAIFTEGSFHKVPVFMGNNDNEMSLFVLQNPAWLNVDPTTFASIAKLVTLNDTIVENIYDPVDFGLSYRTMLIKLLSHSVFICGTRRIASLISMTKGASPVYRYSFNHAPQIGALAKYPFVGSFHYAEVPFLFGNLPAGGGIVLSLSAEEQSLSDVMREYHARFILSTASPNTDYGSGKTNPLTWAAHSLANPFTLNFEVASLGGVTSEPDRYAKYCNAWDQHQFNMLKIPNPFPVNITTPVPTKSKGSASTTTPLFSLTFVLLAAATLLL